MSQAWMIASGKGGVGKSTLSAALAVGLAMRGQQVALVDADIGLRNLDVMLGLESHILYDLVDVLAGTCKLGQALTRHPRYPALALLPAAQMSDPDHVKAQDMRRLIFRLKRQFAYVLVDCPAGIGRGFANVVGAADDTILVTTPDDVAMRDVERVCSLITAQGLPRPMLIVNQADAKMVREGVMYAPQDVAAMLDLPLLGVVPKAEQVYLRMRRNLTAIEGTGDAQAALGRIVRRLTGEQVPIPQVSRDERGVLSRLLKPMKQGSEWL